MSKHAPRHLLIAAVLALVSLPAAASPARVERLTDLVAQMLPIGRIFDQASTTSPDWPVVGAEDKVTVGQLGCLRGELSSTGYRRIVRERVQAYVAKDPARIPGDIKLLEQGSAELFGRLVMAGAEGESSGNAPDPEAMLAAASPAELASFETFFTSDEYAGLREVVGVGEALSPEKSAEDNETAGEQLGSDFAGALMQRAIKTCGVTL